MKINDFFQKGYYINLDRRPDRRQQFEEEAKRIGLPNFFERVSAIDGSQEVAWEKKHYYCGATYHKLLSKVYNEGWKKVVIFEDDACFYNAGKEPALQIVEKALDQLDKIKDWDLVYFGGYIVGEPIERVSDNLLKPNTILTTHAIGYTRSGIEKILKYRPFNDSALDGWIGDRKYITKYFVYPMAIIQRESPSDLDATGWCPDVKIWTDAYERIKIDEKIPRAN